MRPNEATFMSKLLNPNDWTGRPRITLERLLDQLSEHKHQASQLIEQTGLPRFAHPTLFLMLGYLARADGRVAETDILFTETMVRALGLKDAQRAAAIEMFRQGKRLPHLVTAPGRRLRWLTPLWPSPALRLLIALCHASQINGRTSRNRARRCEQCAVCLGLSPKAVSEILTNYRVHVWGSQTDNRRVNSFEQACVVLGVSPRDKLDAIKMAYRRLVSHNHPDKLSRTASFPEREAAKERMLQYQDAWQLIRRIHRNNH